MKRFGNLISCIAEPENLRLAFYKAQKGKSDKPEVCQYAKNLDANLKTLRQQILSAQVEVGNYRTFTVYEPKERKIVAAAFSERVLHHALMNVCHPIFERHLIYDTYACRPGKGTYAAIDRATCFTQKYTWFLKLDYRKYFDSIDHGVLKSKLERIFKEKELLQIYSSIIDSYEVNSGKGLPIGNLSSQYFANYYLSSLDHLIKENWQIPAYVRYMDDMVLFSKDKQHLMNVFQHLLKYSHEVLKLEYKPLCLNKTITGIPFLGYILFPNKIKLGVRSKKRYKEKIKYYMYQFNSDCWSENELQRRLMPLISFTRYAQALSYRKNVLDKLGQQALGY